MQSALRIETTVLPGHRLEISAPELPGGAKVEVIVILPATLQLHRISVLHFLESLPPGPHAFPTWEEFKKHLQEEKEAWDTESVYFRSGVSRHQSDHLHYRETSRLRAVLPLVILDDLLTPL